MLKFLSNSPSRRTRNASRFARPSLEPLEMRYCLSSVRTLPSHPLSHHLAQSLTISAPVITSFTATCVQGSFWVFAGQVSATSYQGMTVTFGGLPSLQGKVVNVSSTGAFSLEVQLQPGEGGTATAQATDFYGQQSNLATTQVVQGGSGSG